MARRILILAGVLGFLAVALGAFGAHALEGLFSTVDDGAKRRAWWDTAVEYHMWHTLLLVGVGLLATRVDGRALAVAVIGVLAGVVLFSGSLYVMTITGIRWLGAITPFGGTAFLVAWVATAVAARALVVEGDARDR